ncbi:uncharacterized protein LOC108350924 isoform X2 [Rattus norvegicus]|uniref:uncharacterized protein LOC108350924 isoform X2 n=1 Tax=Rattus norvegicus TaxID=10116 RepID=UPI002FD8775D
MLGGALQCITGIYDPEGAWRPAWILDVFKHHKQPYVPSARVRKKVCKKTKSRSLGNQKRLLPAHTFRTPEEKAKDHLEPWCTEAPGRGGTGLPGCCRCREPLGSTPRANLSLGTTVLVGRLRIQNKNLMMKNLMKPSRTHTRKLETDMESYQDAVLLRSQKTTEELCNSLCGHTIKICLASRITTGQKIFS